jgi:hypothetical protein
MQIHLVIVRIYGLSNTRLFTIEIIGAILKLTYKECARDKLVDHTATYQMQGANA